MEKMDLVFVKQTFIKLNKNANHVINIKEVLLDRIIISVNMLKMYIENLMEMINAKAITGN